MRPSLILLAVALALTACARPATPPEEAPPPEPPEEEAVAPAERETRNVLYRGTVGKAGISIYMEGTHRLALADGRFLLLESERVALDDYVGKEVEVRGDVRSTVEAGGLILRVKEVSSLLLEEEEKEIKEEKESKTSAPSKAEPPPIASEQPPTATPPPPTPVLSAEIEARIEAMAKENMTASNWTQQYCSSWIGFCIPVHRDWWYKSFGASAPALWHVELNSQEIVELGEGPIVANLVTGALSTVGASDGEARSQGEFLIGYRAWTENRHFEISGPANLGAAIEYITKNLTSYESPKE